jgi:alpha-ketoglutarate-dependent 2,4-dichlorophenoxyacetate dioxygenase
VSNLDERGQILSLDDQRRAYRDGNQLWHTDSSFRQKSATWSMLHARIIPPDGADTEFADTRAAYDALPAATKTKLEGLIAEHSIWHSRAQLGGYTPTEEEKKLRPPARHPVVRRHPGSGRNALYIASHASHIIGWPVDEGRKLLEELLAFATQPRFVYRHKWRLGDLVMWDNRCTLHRATPFESTTHVRDMRRSTVIDTRVEAMAS